MLSDYRVIEFSDYPAGSILGMHLADQGAEVIKVEPVSTSEKFEILEIQGTAEGKPFSHSELNKILELGNENRKTC